MVAGSWTTTNTVIAGVYGMNFGNMPELRWMVVLAVMATVFVALYIGFKRSRWL